MTKKHRTDPELDRRLAGLTRHADPDPALWRAIEARIDRDQPAVPSGGPASGNRRWRWIGGTALAASIAGALSLGLLLRTPSTGSPDDARPSLFQLEQTAMQAAAPAPLATLFPDAPESLMAAWAENQAAIDELERALQRDPDNRLLLEFLAQARLRQARLLQHGISRPQTRSIEL